MNTQVNKSVVTQPFFIPQWSFNPQNEAGNERIRLGQDLNQSEKNYADHDAKTATTFSSFRFFPDNEINQIIELVFVHC